MDIFPKYFVLFWTARPNEMREAKNSVKLKNTKW
jgi:hypothetical protein